jgi:hypothetical protein
LRLFIHEETETAEGGRVSRSHLFIFSLFFSLTCSFDGSKSVRSFVIMSLNRFVYLKPPRLPTFFPDENCWFVPSELFVRASARAIFALGDSSSDSGPTRSPEWDRFHLQVMKKRLWFSTFAMSVPSLSWQTSLVFSTRWRKKDDVSAPGHENLKRDLFQWLGRAGGPRCIRQTCHFPAANAGFSQFSLCLSRCCPGKWSHFMR